MRSNAEFSGYGNDRALMAAGKLLGIPILDHTIVTRDSRRWYSMYERGTLPSAV
jgi:hypothetical protein